MLDNHGRALNTALPELTSLLSPLVEKFCDPIERRPRVPVWQDASTTGMQAARQMDRVLRTLLTTSANTISIENACPDLSAGMSSVQAAAAGLVPEK